MATKTKGKPKVKSAAKAAPGLDKTIREVADSLFEAERTGQAIAPVRDRLPENDVATAYRVQEVNTKRALAAGRRLVGRKIGLTAVAVQSSSASISPTTACCSPTWLLADGEEVVGGPA